jgi:type VI secretion system secreted protein VgrG
MAYVFFNFARACVVARLPSNPPPLSEVDMLTDHLHYTFTCETAPEDTITVIKFRGREAVSECYEFNIALVGPQDLDVDAIIEQPASFTISTKDRETTYHGLVVSMDQLQAVGGLAIYSARLAPGFSMLKYASCSQVFLKQSLPEIIETVLKDNRITSYHLALQHQYPKLNYVCQYNESAFDFLSRWMESRGLYYYFKQGERQEQLIITDSKASCVDCLPESLVYSPPSGLDEPETRRRLTSLLLRRSTGPCQVRLRDYSYLNPSLDFEVEAMMSDSRLRENYTYGEDLLVSGEGDLVAKVRAEELACRKRLFIGESLGTGLLAGYSVEVEGHFREECNGRMQLLDVVHGGHQLGRLPAGLDGVVKQPKQPSDYTASLTAIPADIQFRPARRTKKPGVKGAVNAMVETEGTGEYAMLDELGRYKVRLPFDLSGHPNTKASCWLRKAEPYAGSGHGMHFPLQAGTEVLLEFINGDIDRPFIAAAVCNAEAVSQVTSKNPAANVIRSAANNQIIMGDKRGKEFISLYSPYHESCISVGSVLKDGGGSIAQSTQGGFDSYTFGDSNSVVVGTSSSATGGIANDITVGVSNSVSGGISTSFSGGVDLSGFKGWQIEMGSGSYDLKNTSSLSGLEGVKLSGGYSDTVANLTKKATGALVLAGIGAAVGAAGASFMSEAFADGGLKGDGPWPKALGGIFTPVGATLSGLASGWAMKLIKEFDKATASSATSLIDLSKKGVSLAVDSGVTATGKLVLAQGRLTENITDPSAETSQITMSGAGDNIILTNQENAKFSMSGGDTISAEVTHQDEVKARQVLDTSGVVLEYPTGGKATLDSSGAIIEKDGGAKVTVDASVKLESGSNDSITVSGTSGITLKFNGGNMKAGPLKIDKTGVIQMG